MSRICELHDQAMDIMNEGLQLQGAGREYEACEKFFLAYEMECEAAHLVERKPENEPSRGMLFLGAASLAMRVKAYEDAERLVCDGLSGFPTPRVREELRKLYTEIKFEQTAYEESQELTTAETIIRFMEGDGVGYGRIRIKEFLRRVDAIDKLVSRTIQRIAGLPFEAHPKKHNIPSYSLDIGLAKAGSFGFKVHLTQSINQQLSLTAPPPSDVICDLVNNIALVNEGEEEKLKENFNNDEYSTNFIAQAKELLPDGNRVTQIGFISKDERVFLKKTKKEIDTYLYHNESKVRINNDRSIKRGYLRISDGIKGIFTLISEDNDEEEAKIYVRDALNELAKKYFGDLVEVVCEKKHNKFYLIDINPVQ